MYEKVELFDAIEMVYKNIAKIILTFWNVHILKETDWLQ